MKCQFCNTILADMEEMQSHHVSSCPAIEDENFTGLEHQCAEIVFIYMGNNGTTEKLYVLLSDRDENIELSYTPETGAYTSGKINMNVGRYDGQLILHDEIISIESFEVCLQTEVINIFKQKAF